MHVLVAELREQHQMDISYTNFYREVRRRFPAKKIVTLRKVYQPAEKVEVDFCHGIDIYDKDFKNKRKTHLFVMSLLFSSYVYAEFVFIQKIADFMAAHEKAFRFFGGVTKAHLYDLMINKTFKKYSEYTGFRTIPFFEEIAVHKTSGKYLSFLKKLIKLDVLILDDFGLGDDTHSEATFLVDLLENRQSTGLQMVTSQVDPKGWKGLFEDPVIADAVIDRIINPSHHIILKGGSYREKLTAKC
ncbi:MAG: ATP-binding protein [Proteobacteria bacterium]|nr:ATP-binding protein [Pseudomonadota bacterium]